MRITLKVISFLFLLSLISTSYAINVSVQSTSSSIVGLGFTVNGKNHGGAGTSYTASNMPAGTYTFGVRKSIIHGDVGCATKSGQTKVKLSSNTKATLNFNGTNCVLELSSN